MNCVICVSALHRLWSPKRRLVGIVSSPYSIIKASVEALINYLPKFHHGFDDPRLQKIWDQADDTDKLILRYLSEGYTQRDIATKIGITQAAISLRLTKLKK